MIHVSVDRERKFSEKELALVLANFPEGATPATILKHLGLSWDSLTRKEYQSFVSALKRLYGKREAIAMHVYNKFITDNSLPYEIPKEGHHTRIIFHKTYEGNFLETKQRYDEWLSKQPLPTKPHSIGTKYAQRALESIPSEPVTYQPRSVDEATIRIDRKPTIEEQKAVLFALFDNKWFTPTMSASVDQIASYAKIDDVALVLKILQMGSEALGEQDKIFEQEIAHRKWFLTQRGRQRVAEIRFGAIEFMLDESIAGICLNKWNRKAIHFVEPGKTIEEIAMTIGYAYDNSTVLPEVARRYALEEISRMIKVLGSYGIIRAEQHELMPGMTKVLEVQKPDVLKILRFLSMCVEHLHTLFTEDERSESLLRTLIPADKITGLKNNIQVRDLMDLLTTGYFASPTPLQLVTKYVPDLSNPDADVFEKMKRDFNTIGEALETNTEYAIKKLGDQYWLMKKRKA